MTMGSADLPSVEESELAVVPHDPEWARMYVQEARLVESALGSRCAAVEHVGSTAVPDLLAKPIVDILVASADNLSLVPSTSDLWRDNLLVRDYLRNHPLEVKQYAEIKRQAVAASPNGLLGYQNYKRDFMTGLRARALEWRR